ncbi:hypothetical protein BGZ63DRAFT_31210 [Mariannaea sp. PMI_226]|nr:hypothetical protein BGZ63DRAFT_31210 [Mariannaea sp. PMI_226]
MQQQQQRRTVMVRLKQAIGIGDSSRDWSCWFIIAIVIGLVANVIVIIGCVSPNTQPLYLFSVSAEDLINAASNTTTVSAAHLRIDGLPTHWYWGMTGLCAKHSPGGITCQKAFPPVMNIDQAITFAVNAKLGQNLSSSEITTLVKPWTTALSQVEGKLPSPSHFSTFYNAAFACIFASATMAIFLFPLALLSFSALRGRLPRWVPYLVSFLDAATLLSAGILVYFAMKQGPRALIDLSNIPQGSWHSYIGPGFSVLFVGVLFKLLSIEFFFCFVFFAIFLGAFVGIMAFTCFCRGEDDSIEDDTYPFCEYPNDTNDKAKQLG